MLYPVELRVHFAAISSNSVLFPPSSSILFDTQFDTRDTSNRSGCHYHPERNTITVFEERRPCQRAILAPPRSLTSQGNPTRTSPSSPRHEAMGKEDPRQDAL